MSATPRVVTFVTEWGSPEHYWLPGLYIQGDTALNPGNLAGGTLYTPWCLVREISLPIEATYSAYVYSSYEISSLSAVPGLGNSINLGNLDNINWLLNNYKRFEAVDGDVQGAIWKMMGSAPLKDYIGPQDMAKIDALIAEAMQHDGYVPGIGDTIGVVIDPWSGSLHRQPLIVEMKAASLGDRVWHDANANGIQDAGEAGIAGATVELVRDQNQDGDFDDADEVLASAATDARGNYAFTGLTPGLVYQVRFTLPAGYDTVSPRQSDGGAGADSDARVSDAVVLAPGENNSSIDAGFLKSAKLGDKVWHDVNGNGQQDVGETGVAGVRVTLIGGGLDGKLDTLEDNTSVSTITDANGNYKFENLAPGKEYQVQFDQPAGSAFTRLDAGNDSSDSDAGADGKSQVIVLKSGENNTTIDAGIVKPASLGDRVWMDANANGRQDAGEAVVAGVKVTLIGGGADGKLSTTADNTSVETTTDANGKYLFDGLAAGVEYRVQFGAQQVTVFTRSDIGDDAGDSDANANGLTQIVKLTSGENNTTIDAGLYVPASLGDRVWLDANGNGQQDAGEQGVAGARVTLIGGGLDGKLSTLDDNTEVSTTTDADGNYKFTNLVPGAEYQVKFVAPSGTVLTAANKGDDASDSDAGAGGLSQVVTLAMGEDNTSIDAGVYKPAGLGDYVWHDANANGRQDAGEAGIAGVKVALVGGGLDGKIATTADNVTVSTTTGANGAYRFDGLTPGMEYQLTFGGKDGYVASGADLGDDDESDSDAGDAGKSQIVTLVSGEHNGSIDAGVYRTASLGDRVWVDANGNGQQDGGETGVAGVKVTLLGGGADGKLSTLGDNTEVSVTTDANGNYKFDGLTPGVEYQVAFDKPAGSVFTHADSGSDGSDSDAGEDGKSQVIVLDSGENDTTIDAGIYMPASLGDRVWLDANGNGQQDAGELGVAGATVTMIGGGADGKLSTTGDNTEVSVTTDADGKYHFDGLTPGAEYQVRFTAPDGQVFTRANSGNDASDSDAGNGGLSQVVKLVSGENNSTIDAGVYAPAALGDRVWLDANANGQQDDAEEGVAGVKVTLVGGGADGLIATTGDNTRFETTTDANGNYRFDGLAAGVQYQVEFSKPAGAVFTAQDKGNDASDSDAAANGKSQVVTLASGETNTTIDAGIYVPASLGDRVWLDANGNGRQDAGEQGVAGAKVTLIGGGADGLISTTADNTKVETTTDANGNYLFDGLAPGVEYQVQFGLPTGAAFTRPDAADDALDSDAGVNGLSQIVKLGSGEHNATIDAGIYQTASLGDRVWVDANANGQQDAGEQGAAGVKVTLLGGGADGLLSTVEDNTSTETTTDADGKYRFDGLAPGVEYQVRFDAPAGSSFTRADVGNDASDSDAGAGGLSQVVKLASGENNTSIDAGIFQSASLGDRVWFDANGNGQQDAGEQGVAGAKVTLIGGGADGLVSTAADNTSVDTTTDANGNYLFEGLAPGMEYQVKFEAPAGSVFTRADAGDDLSDSDAKANGLSQIVKLASGEKNTSIDAGVYMPASLGDRVWVDANGNGQQDAGEQGAAGVKVTLISGGADGLVSTTGDNTTVDTTTDANGNYKFEGLTAGQQYQVQFGKPSGTVFTGQDKGNDSSDSDANVNGLSQVVTLAAGENNTTIDAGVYTAASLGNRVWLDANANGQQDANEAGVAGVTVTLAGGGADGLLSTTGDNVAFSTTTDANGNYLFKDLVPGMQYQLTFGKPANLQFTKKDVGNDVSDSDADLATGKSQVLVLKSGEYNDTVDAGLYASASLGDRLWIDTNANGIQDDGATGLAGRTVTLIGGGADGLISTTGDNTRVSTVTGADGVYNFSNLTPGVQYQVEFSKPTGTIYTGAGIGGDALDSDANASTGLTRIVTLASGENNKNLDAGLVNVTGDLAITKTDGLTFVTAGQTITYKIVVTNTGTAIAADALVKDAIPSTLTNVTWTSSATNGASGNQLSGTGAILDTVTLAGGSSITYTVTAKVAALVETVSDFSTLATNANVGASRTVNGITAEAGTFFGTSVSAASLWARNQGEDKGIGVLSKNENSGSGESVTGLSNQANNEVIRLTKEAGEQWSSLWVSNLDADGSGGAEIGTLYWSDEAMPDLSKLTTKFTFKYGDFGVGAESGDVLSVRPSNFNADAKYVFFVAGANSAGTNNDYLVWKAGTVPSEVVNTATVTAPSTFIDTNPNNNSATDIDDIKLPAPTPVKRGSIGDTVWEDLNYNGMRETGENGVKGVTVKLLDANGKVLETTVTDANGKYLFDNLNAGNYRVEVVEPEGYFATKANVGTNDTIDSDIDTANGRTGLITLTQGENDLTWDAGLYRKASLGDKVWEDKDHDGIQDSGEGGIGGVTVQLYSTSGALLATTKTNSAGNYKFSNLDPGTYWLKFDKGDVMYQGINMDNWKWGKKNIGSNDAIDSDVNGDGISLVNVTRTDNITLTSGENDMSWDATITPIAIDLNGDGVHTVARANAGGIFDLLGNGSAIASGWLSSSDGFLAVDRNGNGKIDDISELFGGAHQGAGFSQLASYDSNADGVVNAQDAAFGELRIWQDANGNHQTDDGELLSLAQAGVVSLNVGYTVLPFVDAEGNLHLERSSALLSNGQVADMTDVYFSIDARDAAAAGAPTLADLLAAVDPDAAVPVAIVGQAEMVM